MSDWNYYQDNILDIILEYPQVYSKIRDKWPNIINEYLTKKYKKILLDAKFNYFKEHIKIINDFVGITTEFLEAFEYIFGFQVPIRLYGEHKKEVLDDLESLLFFKIKELKE